MKVLEPDQVQEVRTSYGRFGDCCELMQAELSGRGFGQGTIDRILAAMVPTFFTSHVSYLMPRSLNDAILKQADAMSRMADADEGLD